jgi:hypothetical protein
MPKDLREMLRNEARNTENLSKNHRKAFETRLQNELHSKSKNKYTFLKVAASFLVVIGLSSSLYFMNTNTVEPQHQNQTAKAEGLGSISPELRKIEDYYLASISSEIANLPDSKEHKQLMDGYLEKIGELTTEYKNLSKELSTDGLNEKTINALIDNLQLRLKLLYQLKEQLSELKNSNLEQNENIEV